MSTRATTEPQAGPQATRAPRFGADPGRVVFGLLAALTLLYLALPIVNLLVVAPWGALGTTLADSDAVDALKTSLASASISTVLIALGGIPLAYVLARARFRLRPLVTLLVYVPLVFPAVVSGIVQLLLYGRYGPLGSAFGSLFGGSGAHLTDSFAGVVLAQTFVAAPFTVVAARAAFEALPRVTEDVARTLGASGWRVFWTVSVPQAWGGIVAGLALTWLRAFGEFGATAILAYHPYTLPVYVYVQLSALGGLNEVLILAIFALVASVVAIGIAMLATKRGTIAGGHP